MKPTRFPFDITQGSTFQYMLNLTDANSNPLPLQNYSGVMTIKTSYANTNVYDSLTTSNGEITIANAGIYMLQLSANRTANLYVNLQNNGSNPKTTYVYDFTLTNNSANVAYKILYGPLNVYGQV